MVTLLRELFQHQAWADAAILEAVRRHVDAWNDEQLRRTLQHIVVVQRGFLSLFLKRPFDFAKEMKPPESLADLERIFRDAHDEEWAYVSKLEPADLERPIDMPWIPGCQPSLGEELLQVVMHSQNHRGQCLTRLRAVGGNPPTLDFILWVKEKPAASWATA